MTTLRSTHLRPHGLSYSLIDTEMKIVMDHLVSGNQHITRKGTGRFRHRFFKRYVAEAVISHIEKDAK